MSTLPTPPDIPRAQRIAEYALQTWTRLIRIEAFSGVVLLCAAAFALVWANSPWAASYDALGHVPLAVGFGDHVFSQSLHFWVNDALMTVFFLVVGMEIRHEMHAGALSDLRQAMLPIAAAAGGVLVPALIYLGLNDVAPQRTGWAVPTATDIAFAVAVLALLGRAIPANVRIFLLALAIIDDIVAVLIIGFFYSGGLDVSGLYVAALGVGFVLALQQIGVGAALPYVLPAGVLWTGLLMAGVHPSLAGVVLGLMTPVRAVVRGEPPLDAMSRLTQDLRALQADGTASAHHWAHALRKLRLAQRDLLPPVVRVQAALHPWVAFGVMPAFALFNAGVSLGSIDLSAGASMSVLLGVAVALVVGKPAGVIAASWLAVRLGGCRLPPGVTWGGVALVGLLAGIGFTMSIFIAMLAFPKPALLDAAKLGVLLGSAVAAVLGLAWGAWHVRATRRSQA